MTIDKHTLALVSIIGVETPKADMWALKRCSLS